PEGLGQVHAMIPAYGRAMETVSWWSASAEQQVGSKQPSDMRSRQLQSGIPVQWPPISSVVMQSYDGGAPSGPPDFSTETSWLRLHVRSPHANVPLAQSEGSAVRFCATHAPEAPSRTLPSQRHTGGEGGPSHKEGTTHLPRVLGSHVSGPKN